MRRAVPLHPPVHSPMPRNMIPEIIAAVEAPYAATGGTERPRYTMDHSVPCWLISAYELYLIGKRQAQGRVHAGQCWPSGSSTGVTAPG